MRLTPSPAERLEVEPVLGETGCGQRGADQGGPARRAADEHVALGDVGHPPQQGGHVVDPLVDAPGEPGAVVAARTGQAQDGETALPLQHVELPDEQRLRRPAVQQEAVAGTALESLGEGAQRRDPDPGADQGDTAGAGPGSRTEPAEGSLEEGPRAGTQGERLGAAVA